MNRQCSKDLKIQNTSSKYNPFFFLQNCLLALLTMKLLKSGLETPKNLC